MNDRDNTFDITGDETQRSTFSFGRFLIEMIQTVVIALVLYLLIDTVVARVRIENVSMQPTLNPGEFVLVDKLGYRLGDIKHGEIIVFHYPPNPEEDYIKRVVGVPGDIVEIDHGAVIVNGSQLNEPYISAPPLYNGSWEVSANTIFVLGDNRNQSSDSHSWGFVPIPNVVGRAIVIYWPLSELKILTRPDVIGEVSYTMISQTCLIPGYC